MWSGTLVDACFPPSRLWFGASPTGPVALVFKQGLRTGQPSGRLVQVVGPHVESGDLSRPPHPLFTHLCRA